MQEAMRSAASSASGRISAPERAKPTRRVSTSRIFAVRPALPTLPESELPPEIASANPARDRLLLIVLAGDDLGKVIRLNGPELVIGRGDASGGQIQDPGLSSKHARLRVLPDGVYIEDLGSKNGTYVDGTRVTAPRRLKDGDRIGLGGHTVLKFSHADALEEAAATSLYESTVRDSLTGLFNRRYAEARLASELSYGERHGTPVSVLFIDIDHFKRFNDAHGHHVGDAVLNVVGNTIARIVRPEDVLARFGGEEFVVLLRSVSPRNAHILADRICRHVERLEIPLPDGTLCEPITVSIGLAVAGIDPPRQLPAELIERADAAMYEAKRQGRNRVVADKA